MIFFILILLVLQYLLHLMLKYKSNKAALHTNDKYNDLQVKGNRDLIYNSFCPCQYIFAQFKCDQKFYFKVRVPNDIRLENGNV